MGLFIGHMVRTSQTGPRLLIRDHSRYIFREKSFPTERREVTDVPVSDFSVEFLAPQIQVNVSSDNL